MTRLNRTYITVIIGGFHTLIHTATRTMRSSKAAIRRERHWLRHSKQHAADVAKRVRNAFWDTLGHKASTLVQPLKFRK